MVARRADSCVRFAPRAWRAARMPAARRLWRAARARAGFTLIEVIVALVVFAVGVLGAMATATLAAKHLREAHGRQSAVLAAAAVLDSLTQSPTPPEAGERRDGRHRIRWTTNGHGTMSSVALVVEYPDGTRLRTLRFETVHLAPLPRLEGER